MPVIATAAVAATAVVTPSIAAQESAPRGDVLRGPVVPIPYGADGSGLMKKLGGRARLLDGKGRDLMRIRVRGLKRRTVYLWHIHEVDVTVPDPCSQHGAVPLAHGFKHYPNLVANRRGRARATAKARRFEAKVDKAYYVNVDRRRDGTSVGCSLLKAPAPEATPTPTPTPTP